MAAIGVTKTRLEDQRFVIYGAGSAGLGIARQLRDAILSTSDNQQITGEEANSRFWLVDKHGLIKESIVASGQVRQDLMEFVRKEESFQSSDESGLLEVVKQVKPTVLIGCSTHAGAFTQEVVEAMQEGLGEQGRPIIFPLSNPSRLVEVTPEDAYRWTKGRALIATGSPFDPVGEEKYEIAECNNALIYPGLGLGSIISQSKSLTDTMIIAGAQRLAALAPSLKDPTAALLPDFADAPEVNLEVAVAVIEQAIKEGSAGGSVNGWSEEEIRDRVREKVWKPVYGTYVYDEAGME
ncbi:NAD-dependent malic enzyme, mitochondrial [Paramarasmius palmivorus]|uniref:NAD-dependent malic enzyme, mitochondrial n=1 Tax=Paramarasmius palmivorus TaxID=297713 RepID=A0AAW0DHD5_9AGAR